MKNLKSKFSLKRETIATLNETEMVSVKGGITSIGFQCSCTNSCTRVDKFCCCAHQGIDCSYV